MLRLVREATAHDKPYSTAGTALDGDGDKYRRGVEAEENIYLFRDGYVSFFPFSRCGLTSGGGVVDGRNCTRREVNCDLMFSFGGWKLMGGNGS